MPKKSKKSPKSKKSLNPMIDDAAFRSRVNTLMARIAAERTQRLKERGKAIEVNSIKNDLSIASSRTDAKDTCRIDRWTKRYNTKFRALPQIHGDRDPTRRRVLALIHRYHTARQIFIWIDVYCKETKTTYRTNGNTSSWIATAFPELFKKAVILRVHCVADTYKEVQLIHAQHDPPVSDRNSSEILRVWTTSFGIKLQDKLVNPIMGAIEMARVVSKNQVKGGETLGNKLDIITENIEFYKWFHNDIIQISNKRTKNFCRVCFLTFIYLLYQMKGQREEVVKFLRQTIYAEQFPHEAGDPCLALHIWMCSNAAPRSDGDTWEYMRQVGKGILAWNAFVHGKKIKNPEIGTLKDDLPLPEIAHMPLETRLRFSILNKNYIDPKRAIQNKK